MNAPRVVTVGELYYALCKLGVPPSSIRLRDATYCLPDLSYIIGGEFWQWYCAKLAGEGLDTWAPDWDCDDFAWDFPHEAQKAHKRRQRESGQFFAESVAVLLAQLAIKQPGITGMHDFTLVAQWDEAAGGIVFKAVEPQPKAGYRFYDLAPVEWASALLIT